MDDPLADPRAGDLLAARPDEVAAAAALVRAASGRSGAIAIGLGAAQHDATWIGRAAAAFRRAIGRLPIKLHRAQEGFGAVAVALAAYEAELARIKPSFAQVAVELEDAAYRAARQRPTAAAAADLERLRAQAFALLDEFACARQACQSAIAAQRGAAPVPGPVPVPSGSGTTVVG